MNDKEELHPVFFFLYAHSFTVVVVEYELDQTIPVCLFA